MMTNLLATLTIVAITNWTGYIVPSGQEAGIVCKQHIASIPYKGKTNTMVLFTEPTKKAVFRDPLTVTNSILIGTNYLWSFTNWTPNITTTNVGWNTTNTPTLCSKRKRNENDKTIL